MKKTFLSIFVLFAAWSLSAAPVFLGYLYPSGGQQGTTVRVIVGGQGFNNKLTLLTNNPGIKLKAAVRVPSMGYFHPPQRKFLTQFIKNVYTGKMEAPPKPENPEGYVWRKHKWFEELEKIPLLERSMVAQAVFVRANALQEAPSISNRLILDLEIAPDAPSGMFWLRIVSGTKISNEKLFFVDSAKEVMEEPYYPPFVKKPENPAITTFPMIINGQIMPGETDVFSVMLKAGQHYSFVMRASELSPYLGDAVPGHFQGILTLRDAQGKEVAFADDEYHHPDPVLRFTAPKDGTYTLHVSDSIKRGRADFVYRIKAVEGSVPYTPYNNVSTYQPAETSFTAQDVPKTITSSAVKGGIDIKGVLTKTDGCTFRIKAGKGEKVVFELFAARLDSPLDGVLVLRDSKGKVIAQNDDSPEAIDLDLCRRQTDPRLNVTFPADGTYTLQLFSRNTISGNDHFYTLQIRSPKPSVTAVTGSSVLYLDKQGIGKMRVFLQRKDGFKGEVTITSPQLKAIGKAVIPAGKNSGDFRFFLANAPKKNQIIELDVKAEYVVNGKKHTVSVIPAEEAMQAFAYTHLIVARKLYCSTIQPAAHLLKKKNAPAKKPAATPPKAAKK